MPKLDFSDFADKNTLVFENVPVYRDGELVPDTFETWRIPPFTAGTELAIRDLERKALELANPKKGDGIQTLASYWAGIVAVMVKDPVLSAEDLEGYPAALLREVGQEALSFFRFGKLRSELEKEQNLSAQSSSD